MLNRIVIWGASGHARVVTDIIRLKGDYTVIGFIDDINPERSGEQFCAARILGGKEVLHDLFASGVRFANIAVGNCSVRLKIAELLIKHGFQLVSAIHPKAIIAQDATIGSGSVVVGGSVINSGVFLGACTIINTGATVDHDCILGDGVHVGPGAHLGGWVVIGRAAWLGLGALVRDRVRIGAGSIIGMGSVVVRDVPENVLVYGTPARVIKEIIVDDR